MGAGVVSGGDEIVGGRIIKISNCRGRAITNIQRLKIRAARRAVFEMVTGDSRGRAWGPTQLKGGRGAYGAWGDTS